MCFDFTLHPFLQFSTLLTTANSQEIGRAGRDDLPSKCVLYLCREDWKQREIFCRADLPNKSKVMEFLQRLFEGNGQAGTGDVIEVDLGEQRNHYDFTVRLPFL